MDVKINGNTIEKIGPNLPQDEEYDIVDTSGCVGTPGFVNNLHHFYQTLTRNIPAVQNAKLFLIGSFIYMRYGRTEIKKLSTTLHYLQ